MLSHKRRPGERCPGWLKIPSSIRVLFGFADFWSPGLQGSATLVGLEFRTAVAQRAAVALLLLVF